MTVKSIPHFIFSSTAPLCPLPLSLQLPSGHLVPLYQLIHNYPVSLSAFLFVSPLSFLFLLTFSYLPHPSSSPLPSFRGLLIHLLSTSSLINMPPLCLTLSYLYYSVEMSSSRSPISFWLISSFHILSFCLSLFFFWIDEFQEGSSPSLLRLYYLQTICLSESQQDTEIHFLCECVSLCISLSPSFSHFSRVSQYVCVCLFVCVYQLGFLKLWS